ncbi:MAG: tyrosine-type recombinase/integrase [Nitrospira sp.]|nr:tyrosine-type recombinase/integrase [Nitrospira sp.]
MVIRHRTTKKGLASDLDFWWKKGRYRPTLGYDLDPAEEMIEAGKMIERIKTGQLNGGCTRSGGTTMADFQASYLSELKERGVLDLKRPERVLETYLVPAFPQPMRDISYSDGQAYIAKRRKKGASDGTIAREWTILLSLMNFAAKVGEIPANPLQGVSAPKSGVRDRMPTAEEIARIFAVATDRLQRAAMVAMNCGLREEKVWAIRPSWIVQKADGPWLQLPPARSKKKGNPTLLPLNRFAYAALTAGEPSPNDDRVFYEWSDKHALGKAWSRATDAAEIEDLRFHDLRRWFASILEDLGDGEEEEAVPREVVKYLLGHQPADTLERHYLVRSKGWAKKLRRAVEQLGDRYKQFVLERE